MKIGWEGQLVLQKTCCLGWQDSLAQLAMLVEPEIPQ